MSSWTEDRIGSARAMWNEGKSATEIAEILSEGLTRCAVIAKLDRLGLVGSRKSEAAAWNAPATRQPPSPPRRFTWEQAA